MDYGCEVRGSAIPNHFSLFLPLTRICDKQVLTRPPFMAKNLVGVGPYVDWLEEVTLDSVAGTAQTMALYVGECVAALACGSEERDG